MNTITVLMGMAVYGVYLLYSGGFWGTAVCTFSLATVEFVFSRSPYNAQQTFESNWRPVPDSQVPRPRPGQVSHAYILTYIHLYT